MLPRRSPDEDIDRSVPSLKRQHSSQTKERKKAWSARTESISPPPFSCLQGTVSCCVARTEPRKRVRELWPRVVNASIALRWGGGTDVAVATAGLSRTLWLCCALAAGGVWFARDGGLGSLVRLICLFLSRTYPVWSYRYWFVQLVLRFRRSLNSGHRQRSVRVLATRCCHTNATGMGNSDAVKIGRFNLSNGMIWFYRFWR
jgi:hypothetical protein